MAERPRGPSDAGADQGPPGEGRRRRSCGSYQLGAWDFLVLAPFGPPWPVFAFLAGFVLFFLQDFSFLNVEGRHPLVAAATAAAASARGAPNRVGDLVVYGGSVVPPLLADGRSGEAHDGPETREDHLLLKDVAFLPFVQRGAMSGRRGGRDRLAVFLFLGLLLLLLLQLWEGYEVLGEGQGAA